MRKAGDGQLNALDGRLEGALRNLISRAQYVCAHRYGANDPVGTRQIAIDDLRAEVARAIEALQPPIDGDQVRRE